MKIVFFRNILNIIPYREEMPSDTVVAKGDRKKNIISALIDLGR